MTTSTLIFVLIGVGFVSGNIMKMLMWLDRSDRPPQGKIRPLKKWSCSTSSPSWPDAAKVRRRLYLQRRPPRVPAGLYRQHHLGHRRLLP